MTNFSLRRAICITVPMHFVVILATLLCLRALAAAGSGSDLVADYESAKSLARTSTTSRALDVTRLRYDAWTLCGFSVSNNDRKTADFICESLSSTERTQLQVVISRVAGSADSDSRRAAYLQLAQAHRARLKGSPTKSIQLATAAIREVSDCGDPILIAALWRELGFSHRHQNDRKGAAAALLRAARVAQQIGWNALVQPCLFQLSQWEFSDGYEGIMTEAPYSLRTAALTRIRRLLESTDVALIYGESFDELLVAVVAPSKTQLVALGSASERRVLVQRLLDELQNRDGSDGRHSSSEALLPEFAKIEKGVERLICSPTAATAEFPVSCALPEIQVLYVPRTCLASARAPERLNPETKGVLVASSGRTPIESSFLRVRGSFVRPDRLLDALDRNSTAPGFRAVHLACDGIEGFSGFARIRVGTHPLQSLDLFVRSAKSTELLVLTGANLSTLQFGRSLDSLLECKNGEPPPVEELLKRSRILAASVQFLKNGIGSPCMVNPSCPRVVVPLWKPDSRAESAFLDSFYSTWFQNGEGEPARAEFALVQAQRAVRANPDWKHARYWAGWQLWQWQADSDRYGAR